ncbi:MAG: polymerase sigma factor [Frankiales bacterium]|nr:polymerase sigma factor [Frankiales bacterium]
MSARRPTAEESVALVLAAGEGDARAWEALVDAYMGLIWTITRNHRLSASDAADVSQTTWLRLVEHLDALEDPRRVGAWLATTARRECLRVIAGSGRQLLVPDTGPLSDKAQVHEPGVDAGLLAREEATQVQGALVGLSSRCQQLLQLLMLDPPASYDEISEAMGMPVGSIGPTRGRCLERLQGLLDAQGISVPVRSVLGR